jgi:hypothetical protein
MRLAVPLTAPGEAELLAQAGATEFYCGLQTAQWAEQFGNHDSISRRQGSANLSTLDELEQVLLETVALKTPLFLTLNGNYTHEQLPVVLELAEAFEARGGTGIMLCDRALLEGLRRRGSQLVCGLSLLAVVSSVSALEFYRELGVTRMVLPRFLSIAQIETLLQAAPGIHAEALVWLDKCSFIDGYCRFIHGVGYADAPAGVEVGGCAGAAADADPDAAVGAGGGADGGGSLPRTPSAYIATYDTTYRLPACFELFGMPPALPACAACHLEALAAAGVEVFKLGGRGRSLETRLAGLRFLTAAKSLDIPARRSLYQREFGAPCNEEVCYFPPSPAPSSPRARAAGDKRGDEDKKGTCTILSYSTGDMRSAVSSALASSPAVERCLWLEPFGAADNLFTEAWDRVYIGDEGCGRFLSSPDFRARLRLLLASGVPVGIIAPVLTPDTEPLFKALLDELAEPLEVVVNDVGAYRMVGNSIHSRVLGRLLARQNTDPAIVQFLQPQAERQVLVEGEPALLRYAPPPDTLMRHFRTTPLFSDVAAAGPTARGDAPVRTAAPAAATAGATAGGDGHARTKVMLDFPPHGLPDTIPPQFSVLLSQDEVLVALLPCKDCATCPQTETKIGETRARVPLYRRRTTCYYKRQETES